MYLYFNHAFSSTGPKFVKKFESEGGLYAFTAKINEVLLVVTLSQIPSMFVVSRHFK
jgi:hypothetical protein